MSFCLLTEPWLPLRHREGRVAWSPPAAIADRGFVAIAWPRADFRLAALEWLIGLVATAMAPEGQRDWADRWRAPPSAAELGAAFAHFAGAFMLDGDGPRFGQDLEELPAQPDTPESLLIEAPGGATIQKNTALLVKGGRVARLSRAAAAMALHTFQTYAPAGGRGNLTSLRGGGPLTTLVLPGDEPSLWQIVWANVPRRDWPQPSGPDAAIFPWMAPTRTSEAGRTTSPSQVHPLQAFWGLPRRARLDFAANPQGRGCDLGGPADAVLATGWRQRPYGVKYVAWQHPLSPYYEAKGSGWLPVHPQPGGIGYRHWLALVVGDAARRPALNVTEWLNQRARPAGQGREVRLLAAGYDMDNMKARGFAESEMPLPGTLREAARGVLDDEARRMVRGAEQAAGLLRGALRDALLADFDSTPVQSGLAAFWLATQDGFFAALRARATLLEREDAPDLIPGREAWRQSLRKAALEVFDHAVPMDRAHHKPFSPEGPPREVAALRALRLRLNGYQPSGAAFFAALDLPPPEAAKPKGKRKAKDPA